MSAAVGGQGGTDVPEIPGISPLRPLLIMENSPLEIIIATVYLQNSVGSTFQTLDLLGLIRLSGIY